MKRSESAAIGTPKKPNADAEAPEEEAPALEASEAEEEERIF
jgi:hypothetical protein